MFISFEDQLAVHFHDAFISQEAELHGKPWYAGACDRKSAEEALHRSNKVGAPKNPTSRH